MRKIVIGILAHVDSGKTTLSESILYSSGEIRRQGRVDHKDAFLDNNEIERERGITIFSKQAVFKVDDTEFTLLDTPGHVDFSAETERVLSVLDYAVLVISGTDGVQNHTETLWKLLESYNIPVFVFINKMDISPYAENVLIKNLQGILNDGCVNFSKERDDSFYEDLSMCDEKFLNSFLEGKEISDDDLKNAIRERKLFPCFFGAALKNTGTEAFLNGICRYMCEPGYNQEFGARVFKISTDEHGKRLAHLKITGGKLKVRDEIEVYEGNFKKVNEIRVYSGEKFRLVSEAVAGTVCAVTGLDDVILGAGLGFEEDATKGILEPVLNYTVNFSEDVDLHKALIDLKKLEEEDPKLNIVWNERLKEINIRLMGEVQLEILKRIIYERFSLSVEFGQGGIAYKETVRGISEGVGHFEPLRHYAEVHLLIEEGERGSGVQFFSDVSEDELDKNWQRLIMTHLQEKSHIGVLTGSPITDVKISLVAGRAHKKHTEGGDFRQATYRAVRHGLMRAESVLLEPFYKFRLEIPQTNLGRAMTDIQNMGAECTAPEINGDNAVLTGEAPVCKMQGYHSEVISYTKGKGRLLCMFSGYKECINATDVINSFDYNPTADVENTPDSVFCSHGAGFTVRWDEVEDYMHIESVLQEKEEEKPVEEKVSNYIGVMASDSELMRIFEKTYGPIKRIEHAAMVRRSTQSELKSYHKKKIKSTGDKYILVDGYNIIFAWDYLKKAANDNLDLARNLLVDRLCNFKGFSDYKIIVVFDAYKVKGNKGETEKIHNIDVVYTKEAETADMYIEKVTHELTKNHRVRVATSDNLEQLIILGAGAVRVSAAEFLKEIEETEKEIKRFIESNN